MRWRMQSIGSRLDQDDKHSCGRDERVDALVESRRGRGRGRRRGRGRGRGVGGGRGEGGWRIDLKGAGRLIRLIHKVWGD
jgi:hypothetical protein